jgi:hypothetical protein
MKGKIVIRLILCACVRADVQGVSHFTGSSKQRLLSSCLQTSMRISALPCESCEMLKHGESTISLCCFPECFLNCVLGLSCTHRSPSPLEHQFVESSHFSRRPEPLLVTSHALPARIIQCRFCYWDFSIDFKRAVEILEPDIIIYNQKHTLFVQLHIETSPWSPPWRS